MMMFFSAWPLLWWRRVWYPVSPSRVPGGVWLRGDVSEERLQHPDRLQALHVHLCRHRRPALQGEVLLLYRQLQGHREGLPVIFFHPLLFIKFHQHSIFFPLSNLVSCVTSGVTTLTTGRTRRRSRGGSGSGTSSTTTTSSGLCWRSSLSPRGRAGLSEWPMHQRDGEIHTGLS